MRLFLRGARGFCHAAIGAVIFKLADAHVALYVAFAIANAPLT